MQKSAHVAGFLFFLSKVGLLIPILGIDGSCYTNKEVSNDEIKYISMAARR